MMLLMEKNCLVYAPMLEKMPKIAGFNMLKASFEPGLLTVDLYIGNDSITVWKECKYIVYNL